MKKILRDNGLSLVLLGLFVTFWCGQTAAGRAEYNDERMQHGAAPLPLGDYMRSGHFLEATAENWESEFLQMSAYVYFTVFLFQRGSSESKDPDKPAPQDADPRIEITEDSPAVVKRGGWKLKLYEQSLGLAFVGMFLVCIVLHAIGGAREYSEEQAWEGKAAVSTTEYVMSSRFWFESMQNWQSEFLAIGSMVVLSIFLRHRGSPESKRVAAAHGETGD